MTDTIGTYTYTWDPCNSHEPIALDTEHAILCQCFDGGTIFIYRGILSFVWINAKRSPAFPMSYRALLGGSF